MSSEEVLANYGLWAIIITVGVIILAGIIRALTGSKSYYGKPSGSTPRRKKLPQGKGRSPTNRKKRRVKR